MLKIHALVAGLSIAQPDLVDGAREHASGLLIQRRQDMQLIGQLLDIGGDLHQLFMGLVKFRGEHPLLEQGEFLLDERKAPFDVFVALMIGGTVLLEQLADAAELLLQHIDLRALLTFLLKDLIEHLVDMIGVLAAAIQVLAQRLHLAGSRFVLAHEQHVLRFCQQHAALLERLLHSVESRPAFVDLAEHVLIDAGQRHGLVELEGERDPLDLIILTFQPGLHALQPALAHPPEQHRQDDERRQRGRHIDQQLRGDDVFHIIKKVIHVTPPDCVYICIYCIILPHILIIFCDKSLTLSARSAIMIRRKTE